MKISFLGLGIMGGGMALNLLRAGHQLTVYNRSANAALQASIAAGAQTAATPAAAVQDAQIIITMLSDPAAVEAVAFHENTGILAAAESLRENQSLWIDCSTVDPAFSRRLHTECEQAGIRFLDAPVAGSRGPAHSGELVFLVGGAADDLERAQSLFDVMGRKTIHAGGPGNGSALKMSINLMLGQAIAAYSEAVAVARVQGVDSQLVQNVLLNTPVAAPVLAALRERLESGDTSTHFPLKHMRKDLRLAVDSAASAGIDLTLSRAAGELYESALARAADQDFSAIFRVHNPV